MLKEKQMFNDAFAFLERHYNDKTVGSLDQVGSIAWEYNKLQKLYRGSLFWQELLLNVLDQLERKMKYDLMNNVH